jgi:hypothetical protein
MIGELGDRYSVTVRLRKRNKPFKTTEVKFSCDFWGTDAETGLVAPLDADVFVADVVDNGSVGYSSVVLATTAAAAVFNLGTEGLKGVNFLDEFSRKIFLRTFLGEGRFIDVFS